MRGIDIFCASQAATAIRVNMDEGSSSSSSSSTIHLSAGRAIDRHNPIITDSRRIGKSFTPCSSEPPITPKPYNQHQKSRKSSSKANDQSKKSSAKPNDQKRKSSCAKPSESSRYLLSDTAFLDVLSDFDPVLTLVPVEHTKSQAVKPDESSALKPPSSSHSPHQVVVLRVSLHCKGCEGKVRKHISRMKGVTSFNIDFAAKKVTVVGDVTPLEVLASVSKVKNAQLWTPAVSSLVRSDIKKNKGVVHEKQIQNSTIVV
uniref:HMA domain-containing protein n=1 Tax=Davidia involucrata TaxID=16924 RepID=A0A5B6YZQ7_DAVIN